MSNNKRQNYSSIQSFENIYLEDSFVLGIKEFSDSIQFRMEIVLTQNHPLFTKPKMDEAYCYKNGRIIFSNVERHIWIEKKMLPFKDLNNEVDYGNIDEFYCKNNSYHLSGDWGELKIQSVQPTIKFDEEQ